MILGLINIVLFSILMSCTHDHSINRNPSSVANCDSDFAQTYAECKALELWRPENFSDSDTLDQNEKFQIIFHSITGRSSSSWTKKLLKDPTQLERGDRISASLISETAHSTFVGIIGFILEVPKQNYIATSNSDLGSTDLPFEELIEEKKKRSWKIQDPNIILERTKIYNEIVIIGTNPRSQTSVKVKGIILDCPVKKMVKLNGFSKQEFFDFTSKCTLMRRDSEKNLRPLIWKLINTYPLYGYPTFLYK